MLAKNSIVMVVYSLPLSSFTMKITGPRGQAVKTSPFHGGNTVRFPSGSLSWPMWLNS